MAPPPITDDRLAIVRREVNAFDRIPSSDVKRLLARLDEAERDRDTLRRERDNLLRPAQPTSEGVPSLAERP